MLVFDIRRRLLPAVLWLLCSGRLAAAQQPQLVATAEEPLPDSPGSLLVSSPRPTLNAIPNEPQTGDQSSSVPQVQRPKRPEPCSPPKAAAGQQVNTPCPAGVDPYQAFLVQGDVVPLSPQQKGYLAFHDVIDPFNVLTILANSAFVVGIDSHSAYGPGMKGYGKNVGVSFLQDSTGEFIGTFAVCSLVHEDPHYHRLVYGPIRKRMIHAIARTVIAQHDDGRPMPNYENFITYPASAEISNLYVPGIHGNGPSTVARIATGLTTDPVNNIITEFLPDFARHVHVRVVFVQQILNQIATGQMVPGGGSM